MAKTAFRIVAGLLRYGVWVLLTLLCLWTALQLRINVLDVLFLLRASPWVVPAIANAASLILVFAWLGLTLALESFLMGSQTEQLFWRRTGRIALVAGCVLALSYLLQALI